MSQQPSTRHALLALALILIAAFGLRVYELNAYPLWWDEGITLTFSRMGLAENVTFTNLTEDVKPPIYRWVVGGFTGLAGTSVFTTRLVNVYTGVVVVAAGGALARRLFSARVGVVTAALIAASPMAIYYAQEAKGYSFVAAALMLGALAWLALHRWLLQPNSPPPHPLSYAVMTPVIFCAMGAHYFAILGVISLNLLAVVVSWPARHRAEALLRHWGLWLGAQAVGGALLLPFVLSTLGGTSTGLVRMSSFEEVYGPLGHAWNIVSTLAAGLYTQNPSAVALTGLLVALAAAGTALTRKDRIVWGVWLWVLVPLVLGFLFQLRFPWFFPRFLLYTQPGLAILAAVGIVALGRHLHRAAAPAALLVALTLSAPLWALVYQQPTLAEDTDWPPLYHTLNRYVQPGDVVLMTAIWMPGYMYAYLPPENQADWELAFFEDEAMGTELRPLLADYDRIWQVDYLIDPLVTPTNTLEWMRGRGAVPFSRTSGVGTLTLYHPAPPAEALTERATFAGGIQVAWAPLTASATPGGSVVLPLEWQTDAPLDAAYVRFLHVVDGSGQVIAQSDREPVIGDVPTYTWQPGEPISDAAGVLLAPGTPPGTYQLHMGLYDRDTLERLPTTTSADHIVVGTITVP